jgi:trans-2,3-dihydro-3-hydroxyanthranilate isomerase
MEEKMMARAKFYILDVFAEKRYAGNQLAVFRHVEGIDDAEMQQIARETNFSETTFIISEQPENGSFRVRIFTPGEEVPFAGHPTLGTAFILQQEIIRQQVERVVLNLKIGEIPVTFNYLDGKPDILWMKQQPPTFGQTLEPADVAKAIGLSEGDIDSRFPIQEVTTGLPAIIVPLRNLKTLQRAVVDRRLYFGLIAKTTAKAILIFCPESHEGKNQVSVRFFADFYGITEDPATGSANGSLAGYLVKHRYFGTDLVNVRAEQGYEIGRPSLLHLNAAEHDQTIDVSVGGKVVMSAMGEWL